MEGIKYHIKSDVLVVGSGLAGSLAALSVDDHGHKVVLVNKGKMCWSGATVICGGNTMTACFPEDKQEDWMKVYVEHSDYTVDQEWVKIFQKNSFKYLEKMRDMGRKHGLEIFPEDPDKGKDSYWRIYRSVNPNLTTFIDVYAALETFEKEIMERAIENYERISITDLVLQDGKVAGAVGFHNRTGEGYFFEAKRVILAAGSCAYTADIFEAGGEGYAMAYDAGAKLMSFDRGGAVVRPRYVMSVGTLFSSTANSSGHALGGRLVNRLGEDFFKNMTDEMRRSGRVGQNLAIEKEIEEGRGPIYEDYTQIRPEVEDLLKKLRKPFWKRTKAEYGIDLFEEKIEIRQGVEQTATPDLCNRMGGVWIDHTGETSIPGLYSVGDNTWPALAMQHPYNGAELGWAVVSGNHIGEAIDSSFKDYDDAKHDEEGLIKQAEAKMDKLFTKLDARKDAISPTELKKKIIDVMVPYDTVHESRESLEAAVTKVQALHDEVLPRVFAKDVHDLRLLKEAEGMLLVAECILRSELSREESRCGMRRKDFPFMNNIDWLKRVTIIKNDEGKMVLGTEDIESPYYDIPQTLDYPKLKRI